MKKRRFAILAVVLAVSVVAQTGAKAPKRFVISDYGALTDGSTVNTEAIQSFEVASVGPADPGEASPGDIPGDTDNSPGRFIMRNVPLRFCLIHTRARMPQCLKIVLCATTPTLVEG